MPKAGVRRSRPSAPTATPFPRIESGNRFFPQQLWIGKRCVGDGDRNGGPIGAEPDVRQGARGSPLVRREESHDGRTTRGVGEQSQTWLVHCVSRLDLLVA